MGIIDYIVLAAIAACVLAAVAYIVSRKRKGRAGSSCAGFGSCPGCSGSCKNCMSVAEYERRQKEKGDGR